jgi:hypothetical protein
MNIFFVLQPVSLKKSGSILDRDSKCNIFSVSGNPSNNVIQLFLLVTCE